MKKKRLSIVIDTNVFVSSLLIKRGIPFEIVEAWRRGQFLLVVSDEQKREIELVFCRKEIQAKYHVHASDISALLHLIDLAARNITLVDDLLLEIRDPKDAHIILAAITGHVDYLVTGDQDLLALAGDPRLASFKSSSPKSSWTLLLRRLPWVPEGLLGARIKAPLIT